MRSGGDGRGGRRNRDATSDSLQFLFICGSYSIDLQSNQHYLITELLLSNPPLSVLVYLGNESKIGLVLDFSKAKHIISNYQYISSLCITYKVHKVEITSGLCYVFKNIYFMAHFILSLTRYRNDCLV